MKRKQRPNVSLLLWLTKEFIILSILSNLVCTALYMAVSWLLTGTPLPASHSSGLGPLLFLIGSFLNSISELLQLFQINLCISHQAHSLNKSSIIS